MFHQLSFLSDEEASFAGSNFGSALEGLVQEVEAVTGEYSGQEGGEDYYAEQEEEDYKAYQGQYGSGNFKILSKKPKKPKPKKLNGA